MAISNLVNARDLDVNVNSITTVGDLTIGGALNLQGGLDFSFNDVNLTDLEVTGTVLGSGYRSCIKLGEITTPADAAVIEINATDEDNAVAMGLNNFEKSFRVWGGSKAGNQRKVNWDDSTISVADTVGVSVPTTFGSTVTVNGELRVNGPLVIPGGLDFSFNDVNLQDLEVTGTVISSGYRTCIKLGEVTTPADAALIEINATDEDSAVGMGLNNFEKSLRVWGGSKAGNQRKVNWDDSTITIADTVDVSVPTTFGSTVTMDGTLNTFGQICDGPLVLNGNLTVPSGSNFIQSGTVSLGPAPINGGDALDGGQANYLRLQLGHRDSKTWLYMLGSSEPTPSSSAITYGRIAATKAYFATLQHPVRVPFSYGKSHHGLLVSSVGSYIAPPHLSEAHFEVALTDQSNKSAVYGVLSPYDFITGQDVIREDDNDWLQRYTDTQPQKANDKKVAFVNQGGEGMMWVCDEAGSIRNGDLLCPSAIPGMACRQTDTLIRSDTVFKATTSTDFRTDQSFSYPEYVYDASGNRTVDSTGKDFVWETKTGTAGKVHTVQIFNNRFEISKGSEVVATVPYDFLSKSPSLSGRRYSAVLVGGLYKM